MINQRQAKMLDLLETEERVAVADLARMFSVSDMTIRRDLEGLEQNGAINRVHGGAVRAQSRSYEPPFPLRSMRQLEAKRRIGAAAAKLVRNGETVILDAGTTTLEVARCLRGHRDLRVLALSLHVANVLIEDPRNTVMMCGGVVRWGEQSMTGPLAQQAFSDFSFDTYFLSVGGIDVHSGATEYNPEDAAVKRAAFRNARRRIAVADSSKLGSTAFARICATEDLDVIVTDDAVAPARVEELRATGVQVLLA